MLIPSIDLMGGKIVQLVQGEKKALEFDDFEPWLERFAKYPLVQIIDLDAAIGQGNNRHLVRSLLRRLPCQVGGGIRTAERAQEMLADGALRVIIGSSLIKDGAIQTAFAKQLAGGLGADKLIFAVDSKGGRVAIRGWRQLTEISAVQMVLALEAWCGGFLYTHIDTEGLLLGMPLDVVSELRSVTAKRLIVAGGIRTQEEVDRLDVMGVDAVVGMAIYLELLKV
ncbi:MAG: 1-(5-phosphoribosyl)-5-[(5-phosphoribosylamino)methylideneamino] imidazole-4-carboxamide isomerase [Acidobacteriia bacterium]|jgi:phosphoribosylformimino-5-aminoimidazole carboxamide ribotide isomerase|nr:1-(5-phosphoribosyl)-5-[(5-phosphoribosylamino)methylideneamino] imidazole-4-carboxamide isomerase [Terriglobia bacterium]